MFRQGILTEGEGSVQLTSLCLLVPFDIANIIYLFYQTSYLNEEVNCTEPSPSVSVPWFGFVNVSRLFQVNWLKGSIKPQSLCCSQIQ
jgi:hypothetical protein